MRFPPLGADLAGGARVSPFAFWAPCALRSRLPVGRCSWSRRECACFVPGSQSPTVIASEGGHATMATTSDREDAIINYLRRQFSHVSAERVISGSGLSD